MKTKLAILLACGLLSASAAQAQTADGRRIAEAACAQCHDIVGDAQSGAKGTGPGFAAVARMPSTTELALKVFLRSSHRDMPNLMLSAEEIDALAAYILGLAGK